MVLPDVVEKLLPEPVKPEPPPALPSLVPVPWSAVDGWLAKTTPGWRSMRS